MSRSTRKPYGGYGFDDLGSRLGRAFGHRCYRHAAKIQINTTSDFEDFLPLHPYEIVANDPWLIGCNRELQTPSAHEWFRYCAQQDGFYLWPSRIHAVWPPIRYLRSLRK